ncbi:tetratricopeptide repeat protein [Massilia sp. W12]|uniref:tetratricopeptide repeat protein n=1 Tax=Massilia sp. W12 TaxID=3126507 RepID=UPI0030CB0640
MRTFQSKCLALLLACSLSAAAQAEPIVLSGVLLQETEDGQPYAGLLVSAHGGVNSKSDSKGNFQMVFNPEYSGQEGNLLVNYPNGWKVMFSVMLKYKLLPNGAKNQIIACPVARCDALRKTYLTQKNLVIVDKRFKERLAALKNKVGVKQEEIAQLEAELAKERLRAQDLAEQFARLAEGEVSWQYRQAWDLYLKGEIKQALEVLSESVLEQVEAAEKRRQKEAQQEFENSWLLRANLADSEGDVEAAERAYAKALEVAPQSPDAWLKYAAFQQKMQRFALARKGYEEALKLRRELAQSEPLTHLPNLADTLLALGQLNLAENRSNEAKKLLSEALAILQKLAATDAKPYAGKIKQIQSTLQQLPKNQ